MKDIQNGNIEIELFSFTINAAYVENLKSVNILLWLTSDLNKFAGRKVNILYKNELDFFVFAIMILGLKNFKVSFIIAPKVMKYLGINLTKYVSYLYAETYELLMKEIKDDLSKWRDIPCQDLMFT